MDEKTYDEELVGTLTIGRFVWYHLPLAEQREGIEFCPALITRVYSGEVLSLTLFMEGDITYVRDVLHGDGLGQWTWPKRMAGVSG